MLIRMSTLCLLIVFLNLERLIKQTKNAVEARNVTLCMYFGLSEMSERSNKKTNKQILSSLIKSSNFEITLKSWIIHF